LVEAGLIDESIKSDYEDEWRRYDEIKGAFLSVPPHVTIVARKI